MRLTHLATLALLGTLSACIPAPAPDTRQARPVPVPVPPPTIPVVPASSDWRDWPLTPGDWRYNGGAGATFGAGQLTIRCDGRRATVLSRPGSAAESVTVRTSTSARTLTMQPVGGGQVAVSLPMADPLIDAMGFSRGRFVIESAGRPPLVVPAWPEILRVAEDCRG
ncbi:hypothetical protein [Sphingomonas sp. RS2018]